MTNQVLRKLSGWLGALACASLLAACGGGGGSPGTNSQGVTPSKAATIVLSSSAPTLASSGQDGTEVTLTAIVKDANNNTLPGETVSFKASSGNITNTGRITNTSGVVTEQLNTKGDSSVRDIKITASVGGVTSNEITVKVVQASQTLTLTTDSGTLASTGAAGSEVTVTALVKDSNNAVMAGVKVDLAVDSGSLTNTNRITNSNGIVSEKLSTGNDPTTRTIKITGTISGLAPVSTTVSVAGTRLQVNANGTVNIGSSTDVTVKLTDSAGNALANKTVTFSSGSNSLAVKGGGAAVTNSAGQLTLTYTAASGTSDTITVRAMGETATTAITISAANFTVNAINGSGGLLSVANINSCVPVNVHSDNGGLPTAGIVQVNSSRGSVYTDAGCTAAMTSGVSLVSGNALVYVKATSPGQSTLTANIVGGGTTQGSLEFVAPLLASSIITLQGDPAVIGTNTAGSTTQQATIRAIVRDGTAANNLVKNALVSFSIVTDGSGGSLTQPALVATGSDGAATVSFVAGTSSTAADGVLIKAQLQGASTASATTSLTVSKRSLFITAGTGNAVGVPDLTTYTKEYVVFVTDASGNAVSGVNITASVLPRYYYKGRLVFPGTDGPWQLPFQPYGPAPYSCPNEDSNGNGILEAGEDRNGDGKLWPGIPVFVNPTTTTDASGTAKVTLTYPRDRANWLAVDLTIRASVGGTEATYKAFIPRLAGVAGDFSDGKVSPPGLFSPYGQTNTGTDADCLTAN